MSSGPGKGSRGQLKKQLRKTSPAQLAQTSRIRMKETPKSYITWKSQGNMVMATGAEKMLQYSWNDVREELGKNIRIHLKWAKLKW